MGNLSRYVQEVDSWDDMNDSNQATTLAKSSLVQPRTWLLPRFRECQLEPRRQRWKLGLLGYLLLLQASMLRSSLSSLPADHTLHRFATFAVSEVALFFRLGGAKGTQSHVSI